MALHGTLSEELAGAHSGGPRQAARRRPQRSQRHNEGSVHGCQLNRQAGGRKKDPCPLNINWAELNYLVTAWNAAAEGRSHIKINLCAAALPARLTLQMVTHAVNGCTHT